MTTPAAWVPLCRTIPSSCRADSITSLTVSSSAMRFNSGTCWSASDSFAPGTFGIRSAIREVSPKLIPRTRPTSRTAIFAPIVPKVMICATARSPYLLRT